MAIEVFGNTTGLRPRQIRTLLHIYRKRIPPNTIITYELCKSLTLISRDIKREVAVLINRKGCIEYVVVGDHEGITIPYMGKAPHPTRLRGLRCIHTHLNPYGLSDEDLTDLAILRLDLMVSVQSMDNGLPGNISIAYLLPDNSDGKPWEIISPNLQQFLSWDFQAHIKALEEEFAGKQGLLPVKISERAILVGVGDGKKDELIESLEELKELATSNSIEVVDTVLQIRREIDPRYLIGKGKLREILVKSMQKGVTMIIFDRELTPSQHSALSRVTDLKIIDRTQLILDIFAQRAHTKEGKLQVELAQLRYNLPRLSEKDDAISRLTGGIGGRGPGETKMEIDRRRARERITRLLKEMKEIKKSRAIKRSLAEKRGVPVVSIVGYTNAGKTTLFNLLTGHKGGVEDKPFATLDPKRRRIKSFLPEEVILTDTVGFIKRVPEDLFAAFRATLEELYEADLIIHVVDVSHPQYEDHLKAVNEIMKRLELTHIPVITVFNKADLLPSEEAKERAGQFNGILISALNGTGVENLIESIRRFINTDLRYSGMQQNDLSQPQQDQVPSGSIYQ